MADEGSLRIWLLEAHLDHNTETFGKMDPYIKMTCREAEWKSSTDNDGGKRPKWHNEHFDVEVHYLGDELHFHVWDDDIGKDESIGVGSTKLSGLIVNGNGIDEWFPIQHKGEPAGKIHLKTEWYPKQHNGHH